MTDAAEARVEAEVIPMPVQPRTMSTLFNTDDPCQVIDRAEKVANKLGKVIDRKKLFTQIGLSKHLRVEAWTTCGAMLGVFPVCVWTRKLENGWEARVEARTLAGNVVGAAEAQCLNEEGNWDGKADFSLRSMAQTRATSKALAMPLRFIPVLAGFSGTPAEEMTGVDTAPKVAPKQTQATTQLPTTPAAPPAEGMPKAGDEVSLASHACGICAGTDYKVVAGSQKSKNPGRLYLQCLTKDCKNEKGYKTFCGWVDEVMAKYEEAQNG